MKPLTPKQQRFVSEYRKDCNATRAAIAAGFSKKSATKIGSQLLDKTGVREALALKEARLLQLTDITADRTRIELARIGYADPRKFYDENGDLLAIDKLDDDSAAVIAGTEHIMKNATAGDGKIDRVLKIKQWDKNRALDTLAKIQGMMTEKIEHSGNVSFKWQDIPA